MAKKPQIPKELQDALLEIVRKCEQEDSWVRKQQIREWKKNERFWHGMQYIYWSETNQDWMSPINTRWDTNSEEHREDAEGPFYDYVINIFKGYGESIIAALSAQMPSPRFPPDDADQEEDLVTSKTYSKIADLITKHNSGKMLLLEVLLNLWNQGIVAAYHHAESDEKYGTTKIPRYGEVNVCPQCNQQGEEGQEDCPNCTDQEGQAQALQPQTVQTGEDDVPKSRVCIEIFGPLFVKVSHWAREQKDFGYLGLSIDQPRSYLMDLYPDVENIDSMANQSDQYEKIGRAPSQYTFTVNDNSELLTHRRYWIRPWQFNILGKDQQDTIDALKKEFPDGAYCAFIGDLYADSDNECIDEHWTIGKGALSQYIHSDPLGKTLIPLQESRNVTFNLALETMEQGIASVFADPDVLNFDEYSKRELRPGQYIPAKAPLGQRLSDSFFEGPKAQLSKDVPLIREGIDQDAQFVSGGFPSIYGGQIEGSSRTAAEYDMSRQMALQRLSICLNLINVFWAKMMQRCVKLYVKTLKSDERYVMRSGDNYINCWIRLSELTGKVGEVEPEIADSFPVTIAQKQSLLLKLIGLNNEQVNAAIFDVENRRLLGDSLGFPDFKIPQENQRSKQVREIQQMISQGVPIPIEPEIDDDSVHIEVARDFLADVEGYELKMTQPAIYQVVLQHLQMHLQNQQKNVQDQQLLQAQIKAMSAGETMPKPGLPQEQETQQGVQ